MMPLPHVRRRNEYDVTIAGSLTYILSRLATAMVSYTYAMSEKYKHILMELKYTRSVEPNNLK